VGHRQTPRTQRSTEIHGTKSAGVFQDPSDKTLAGSKRSILLQRRLEAVVEDKK
jgi:hypothetical protein